MTEPLDLEAIKALIRSMHHPGDNKDGDVYDAACALIAEVERLRENFETLDVLYARHLARCPVGSGTPPD